VGRIVRRVRQAGVYFVTTDTWQRRALFINTAMAKVVVDQIIDCRERGFYELHAFVVMPDHLHVLLTPNETTTIEKAMQMIKGGRRTGWGSKGRRNFPFGMQGFMIDG
jgi:putative transposase